MSDYPLEVGFRGLVPQAKITKQQHSRLA